MPLRDGTGPVGLGPGSGRGRGGCLYGKRGAGRCRYVLSPRSGFLISFALPALLAAIRDLANPGGILRNLLKHLISEKRSGFLKPVKSTQHTVLNSRVLDPDLKDRIICQELEKNEHSYRKR